MMAMSLVLWAMRINRLSGVGIGDGDGCGGGGVLKESGPSV